MKRHLLTALLAAATLAALAAAPGALASGGCQDSEEGCPNEGIADSALHTVERRPAGVHVAGWAYDPNTPGPIDAVIQIDGVEVASILADRFTPRSSVYGTGHGYDAVVPARPGAQVCVSPVMTGNGYGDCKAFNVSTSPTGAFEAVTADATTVRVRGWALDPDSAAPIAVRFMFVDGSVSHAGGQATAGLSRPDVQLAGHAGYGDAHGFEATLTRPSRWTEVCAVALNVGPGSDVPQGCRSIAPSLEITSAGLSPDLNVSSDDGRPVSTSAALDATVLILATGRDWHGGVKRVGIVGESIVTCVDGEGQVAEHRRPISATESHPDPSATSGPTSRSVQHGFNVRALLADCGSGAVWRSLRVELRASVQSFDGGVTTSLVTIHHLVLRVATFNIRWSALPPVCGDPFQSGKPVRWTPGAWAKPCPDKEEHEPAMWFPTQDGDETLRRWGRDLVALADVVLLTEVGSARQAALIAEGAGFPFVYTDDRGLMGYADVAILSRFSIDGAASHPIPPDAVIRDVTLDIGGISHRFLGSHWENDPDPDHSHPDRVTSAETLLDLIRGDQRPVFFGGDLNAHSPQPEVQSLFAAGLVDSCGSVRGTDACAPIDYVLARGPYEATAYQAAFVDPNDPRLDPEHPSDHPFVLVTYVRR